MLARFQRHVRSNGIAYVALFFSLSAPAAAIAITGALIVDESVTGADIKNDSLKGADVLESSLATVPSAQNADTLDGFDASDLQHHHHPEGRELIHLRHTVEAPLVGQTVLVAVRCPDGKYAVSGGGSFEATQSQHAKAHVEANHPGRSGDFPWEDDRWTFKVTAHDAFSPGSELTVHGYALCISR